MNCNNNDSPNFKCETCVQAKYHRLLFESSKSRSNETLELAHSDICGPKDVKSIGGSRYLLTFLDDFNHKVFAYFLKSKDELFEYFKIFMQLVETQTGKRIKIFRTDNGDEFCGNDFEKYLQKSGIVYQLSILYTAEQNGKAGLICYICYRENKKHVNRCHFIQQILG